MLSLLLYCVLQLLYRKGSLGIEVLRRSCSDVALLEFG